MPRPDKQDRIYKVHPDHVTAAHSERIGKAKAERARIVKEKHASGVAPRARAHGRDATAKQRHAAE